MDDPRTPENMKATVATLQLGFELMSLGTFPGNRCEDVMNFMTWLAVTGKTISEQLPSNGATPKIVRS